MQSFLKLASCFLLISSAAPLASADISTHAVSDIAAMQSGEDGRYDVLCGDGSLEIVTPDDIAHGNMCPNVPAKVESGIQSMLRKENGNFDVICKDGTRANGVTAQQIMNYEVCPLGGGSSDQMVLTEGNYTPDTNELCAQSIVPTVNGGIMTSVSVTMHDDCEGDGPFEFTCIGKICSFSVDGQDVQITVIDAKNYNWINLTYPESTGNFSLATEALKPGVPHPRVSGSPFGSRARP